MGQQSYPGNSNRSMYSAFSPDFGCLILRRRDVLEEAFTSSHVRSESGEWADSEEASNSPSRSEPKKAQTEADHTTCFVRGSQSVLAILVPKLSKSGKVTTRLVFWEGFAMAIRAAPFSSWAIEKSLEICSQGKPRRLCINLSPDRYAFMEFGASFLTVWRHITNERQVLKVRGQGKELPEYRSKAAKTFRAEEYFAQVALDRDEFISWEKVSQLSLEALPPRAVFASASP